MPASDTRPTAQEMLGVMILLDPDRRARRRANRQVAGGTLATVLVLALGAWLSTRPGPAFIWYVALVSAAIGWIVGRYAGR